MPYENLPGYGMQWPTPQPLPSHGNLTPAYATGLPSGGTGSRVSGSGLNTTGSFNYGSLVGPTAALVASAFAPTIPDISAPTAEVQQQARQLGREGQATAEQGRTSLEPVLKYFASLMSGNPADVMAATAPDRARVIDQYDSARKTAAQFSPRGGGQASSAMNLKAREASDLGVLPAAARANAANTLGSLSRDLMAQGMSAEHASITELSRALGPLLAQEQMDQQNSAQTWQTIGTIAGMAAMAMSSRDYKDNVRPLSDDEIADRLATLPIAEWNYKGDLTKHVGPMAEDFKRAFGVGDGRSLALVDVMGVLLAAERSRLRRLRG